jgi:putative zinc finger/helix-turn-helix YgiT family protein
MMMKNSELACPKCERYCAVISEERNEEFVVRGEKMSISGEVDVCADCGAVFWTEKYDALMKSAYEEYKKVYGLLSSEEIRQIREIYGLSQDLFSAILGIGPASLQRYETGAVQTIAYDGIIREARDAARFLETLEKNKNNVSPKDYAFAKTSIEKNIGLKINPLGRYLDIELIANDTPSEWNGNRVFSYEKFRSMLIHILLWLRKEEVYITKLNKLLFFIDFVSYKIHSNSITGLYYVRWNYGPVPAGRVSYYLYDYAEKTGVVSIREDEREYGISKILTLNDNANIPDFLDASEMEIVKMVMEKIGQLKAKDLSEKSHKERAWIETKPNEKISYTFAADVIL